VTFADALISSVKVLAALTWTEADGCASVVFAGLTNMTNRYTNR